MAIFDSAPTPRTPDSVYHEIEQHLHGPLLGLMLLQEPLQTRGLLLIAAFDPAEDTICFPPAVPGGQVPINN